jgi:hypothetical protein
MSCKQISPEEAKAIWDRYEISVATRAETMPTVDDALRVLFDAYQRLEELGWREAIYCPKDGTWFQAIEAGSTGIHECQYSGEWPTGHWWIADKDDLYPSRPILFKLKEERKADE